MEQSKITDETLVNYMLGECSVSERLSVQSWIDATAANRKQYAEVKLIWEQVGKRTLAPAADVDAAWETFKQRIAAKSPQRTISGFTQFARVAAILLLLAGCGWLGISHRGYRQAQATVQTGTSFPFVDSVCALDNRIIASIELPHADKETTEHRSIIRTATVTQVVARRKEIVRKTIVPGSSIAIANTNAGNMFSSYHSEGDFICNGTPCPIEICIYQTIKCADGQPSSIATCNILQPDQSGQIPYKALTRVATNCAATVDEIRIKRMNTGETIVLNADSKPSTAQELFNYLTGQKKGDILAGIFHTDCNNHNYDQQLTLDNNAGSLILQ